MSGKECTRSLYFVHAGVVDWRLAIRAWNNSTGFAVRQLGVQTCKYVQHLPRELAYSASLIYHLMYECAISPASFSPTILQLTK